MTNGDVPLLATAGLIDEPRNPLTGALLSDAPKHSGEQHVFYTDKWQTTENNGNSFLPGPWYALHGENIFDTSAWEYLGEW